MNLLMCCTPLGREDKYLQELRYVIIASIFFKELYPDGTVFVGTTMDAKIPKHLYEFFKVVRFPFEKETFALTRQVFYRDFINSPYLSDDTLITGCDVLLRKKIEIELHYEMAMTYRYHKTMPYCSDFLLVKKNHKNIAANFCDEVSDTMIWFPEVIQNGWADQLAIAIVMGFLEKNQHDGEIQKSPKNNKVLLLPGNNFLYTPNDFYVTKVTDNPELIEKDTPNFNSLLSHALNKTGIHFKGNRKSLFFIFAYLCKENKIINFDKYKTNMDDEFLFKEYFDHIKTNEDRISN